MEIENNDTTTISIQRKSAVRFELLCKKLGKKKVALFDEIIQSLADHHGIEKVTVKADIKTELRLPWEL